MRQALKFLVFFSMALVGRLCLMGVEDTFQALGIIVPDLLPIVGPQATVDTFGALIAARAQQTYIVALWTADVLFPIGLAGLLATLIGGKTPWSLLPILAGVMDIMGENVAATLIVDLGMSSPTVWLFVVVHALKWVLIGASVMVLIVKFIVWFCLDFVHTF